MIKNKAIGAALTIAFTLTGAWPASAGILAPGDPPRATVTATLDGEPAERYDLSDPLELRPERELAVTVEVTNTDDAPLTVRSVWIEGRVLGATFIDYDTRVDAVVQPGETVDRTFNLDFGRLPEQAVGLLPVELSVLDDDRKQVAPAVPLTVDAQGELTSTYGMFGLLVAMATALLLAGALVHLARGTLPEHRWYRAVRFAVPGAGVGLTVAVTLSVVRVLVPDPGRAVAIVVACALAGLVLGFLTPHPHYRYEAQPIVRNRPTVDRERAGEAPDEASSLSDLFGRRGELAPAYPARDDATSVQPLPVAERRAAAPVEQ